MTFQTLEEIIVQNNIPKDVHLVSDSGWECCATEMNGIYYNKGRNLIIFTQGDGGDYRYENDPNYQLLHGEEPK